MAPPAGGNRFHNVRLARQLPTEVRDTRMVAQAKKCSTSVICPNSTSKREGTLSRSRFIRCAKHRMDRVSGTRLRAFCMLAALSATQATKTEKLCGVNQEWTPGRLAVQVEDNQMTWSTKFLPYFATRSMKKAFHGP